MGIFRLVYISLLISVVLVSDNVPHTMRDMTITFYLFTIFDVVINKGWWPHQLTIIVWENIEVVVVFQVDISQSVVKPFSLGWYFGDKCSLNLVYILRISWRTKETLIWSNSSFLYSWNEIEKYCEFFWGRILHCPLSIRHRCDISTFLNDLMVWTIQTMYISWMLIFQADQNIHPATLSTCLLKKSISVTTTCKKCKKIVWKGNLQKYGLKSFKQFTNKWSGMMYCKKVNVLS